ncbi:MAG: ABC transporter ATP-binding protein [Opitutaceae bacterium]|jgi:lipopolysaccharide transport system ATP-binding protein
MSLPAIEVSGLSKRYAIEHESRHDNLRDTLHHNARKLWRRLRWGTGFNTEEFMALNDVSFTVQPGEVVGIIGRNGAGKSTLLKILSRITEPTAGKVTIRGRVASLLEVGTGFHPDLTGRENIFLNGAILGMSRIEIRKKFDEIVAFAEIEKFLDTPVKRYSSGMYVRLAFAVAAHLEPEILIVDEVLAVGDAVFQQKCIGKMKNISKDHGRTVLFVSHSMTAVESLTQRVIVMERGSVYFSGLPRDARDAYIGLYQADGSARGPDTWGRGTHTKILAVSLADGDGRSLSSYQPQQPLYLDIVIETDGTPSLSLEVMIKSDIYTRVAMASLHHFEDQALPAKPGRFHCLLRLDPIALASGDYWLDVATSVPNVSWDHIVENALNFAVPVSWNRGRRFDFKQSYGFGCFSLPATVLKYDPVQLNA